jgi:hypothetical protein
LRPRFVYGLRDAEDRDEPVRPGDDHSVDECFDQGLALIGRSGADDLREVVGDLIEQGRVERGGFVVEGGGKFVATGGELLAGGLEGGEVFGDEVFVEGAAFEGEQVSVGGLLGAGQLGGDGVEFCPAAAVRVSARAVVRTPLRCLVVPSSGSAARCSPPWMGAGGVGTPVTGSPTAATRPCSPG